jgi:hypothetical protein
MKIKALKILALIFFVISLNKNLFFIEKIKDLDPLKSIFTIAIKITGYSTKYSLDENNELTYKISKKEYKIAYSTRF